MKDEQVATTKDEETGQREVPTPASQQNCPGTKTEPKPTVSDDGIVPSPADATTDDDELVRFLLSIC